MNACTYNISVLVSKLDELHIIIIKLTRLCYWVENVTCLTWHMLSNQFVVTWALGKDAVRISHTGSILNCL